MLNETMLGVLGFIAIIAIIVLLFKNKTVPAMAFVVVPTILAVILVLGGYYNLEDIKTIIQSGFSDTAPTAALFIFSILFFGIMTDAGMFDVIIGALVSRVGDSVVGITLMTCLIATIGHLDGGGASTFLITIPAMLPIYKKMHMKPTTLLTICVLAMGVLNLMPWAGPTMRSASVLGIEANVLWREILPIQAVGIVLAFIVAFILGKKEEKAGAGLHGRLAQEEGEVVVDEAKQAKANELARPKLFVFNVVLTLAVILGLVFIDLPSYVVFMVGCALALFVNYPGSKMQSAIIKSHAGPAMMMASTLVAAAMLLGILSGYTTGDAYVNNSVMYYMATLLTSFMPDLVGYHLPIVIGILSVPLALAFCTDSYFYGVLPVMITVGQQYGVEPLQVAIAMCVCRNCATFISPMVPATLLGTGLAEVDIKDHIKASFGWVWGFSLICMIAAVLFGIIQL